MSTSTKANVPDTPIFTKEQIDEFCKVFVTLESYRPEDQTIDFAIDGPKFYTNVMKWDRTPEQLQAYTDYVKAYGGRMSMQQYRNYFTTQHNKHQLFRVYVNDFDLDKDGFISKEEFEACFRLIIIHDPSIPDLNFEQVLKEADSNNDGKLSTDELVAWLKNVTSQK